MTMNEYSEIQRLLGNIEGAAAGIKDADLQAVILDALEALDSVINKIEIDWRAEK